MAEIELTHGKRALIDDQDFERVRLHSWCIHKGGGNKQRLYAQANVKVDGAWKRVLLHRFIMNAVAGQRVDHKNNDGLDCRRENLRVATAGQNQHNTGSRGGRSRFKGVSWSKRARKWRVQIMANKKPRHVGLFVDEEEAARAYDAVARELHGEFAKFNFHTPTSGVSP